MTYDIYDIQAGYSLILNRIFKAQRSTAKDMELKMKRLLICRFRSIQILTCNLSVSIFRMLCTIKSRSINQMVYTCFLFTNSGPHALEQ